MHKCVCIHSIAYFHRFLCSAGQTHLFIHIKETVGNLWLWFYTILSLFQEWAKHFDYKLWLVNSILASCILTFHLRSWRWWSSTRYLAVLTFLPVVFIHNPRTISRVVWIKWATLHNLCSSSYQDNSNHHDCRWYTCSCFCLIALSICLSSFLIQLSLCSRVWNSLPLDCLA